MYISMNKVSTYTNGHNRIEDHNYAVSKQSMIVQYKDESEYDSTQIEMTHCAAVIEYVSIKMQ